MPVTVTEIAADTFRISNFHEGFGLQFVQFLVRDEAPFLMHTGFRRSFAETLEGVRKVIDPATLRWIGFSHFEPDECGALNEWLAVAPRAEAVSGIVGASVCLNDFADRPPRALADDEVFSTGSHRLRFLATPHLPHGWDSGFFFDEKEKTLFSSDLYLQFGDPAPLTETPLIDAQRAILKESLGGPLAHDLPYTVDTQKGLLRLAALEPKTLAIMHGSSFRGDGKKAMLDFAAAAKEILGGGVADRR